MTDWTTSFRHGGSLPFYADRYPVAQTVLETRLLPLIRCRDCDQVVLWSYDLPPSASIGVLVSAALAHEADNHATKEQE